MHPGKHMNASKITQSKVPAFPDNFSGKPEPTEEMRAFFGMPVPRVSSLQEEEASPAVVVEKVEDTLAEKLMRGAELLLHPRGVVVQAVESDPAEWARYDIAIRFYKLPPVERFRAIVEEWDMDEVKNAIFH
jgi:hypothetical protein